MTTDHKGALKDAVTEVLEEFAFLLGDSALPDAEVLKTPKCLRASMTARGPQTLQISVAAPYPFCAAVASNTLGVESNEITQKLAEDAFQEFLNIVTGRLSELLYGSSVVVELTPPVCETIAATAWREACMDREAVCFNVEGWFLVATVKAQG